MTDASRIADSTWFKLFVPLLQTLLASVAVGAFMYVYGSIQSMQAQINSYQTNQALITQRVEGLERSRDANDRLVDNLRIDVQENKFRVAQIMEWQKGLVLQTRPK